MRILPTLLVLSLGAASMAAAPMNLVHGPAPQSDWPTRLDVTARVPAMGTKQVTVGYRLSCSGRSGDLSRMALELPEQVVEGRTVGPVSATFMLAGDGSVSSLQSPQAGDPSIAPFLRNAGLLFPPLPDGRVDVGETWTGRSVIHLGPGGVDKGASLPASVRLDGTYVFSGRTPSGMARVAVRLNEAAGEKVRVALTGEFVYDGAKQRVVSVRLAGQLKVRRIVWITVPVELLVSAP